MLGTSRQSQHFTTDTNTDRYPRQRLKALQIRDQHRSTAGSDKLTREPEVSKLMRGGCRHPLLIQDTGVRVQSLTSFGFWLWAVLLKPDTHSHRSGVALYHPFWLPLNKLTCKLRLKNSHQTAWIANGHANLIFPVIWKKPVCRFPAFVSCPETGVSRFWRHLTNCETCLSLNIF